MLATSIVLDPLSFRFIANMLRDRIGASGVLLVSAALLLMTAPAAAQVPDFTRAEAGLTGVQDGSSSIADVDGDGNQDLLITGDDENSNETTTLYLGDGSGGFTEASAGLTDVQASSSSIADVDGDGNQDLLITGLDANGNETAKLYLGDGSGGFTEAGAGLTGVFGGSSSIADVDGDGNQDLLITGDADVSDGNPSATLYLGDGSGSFSETNAGLAGVTDASSSIADVDEDGNLDLLITGDTNGFDSLGQSTTLYFGDGSGDFPAVSSADLRKLAEGSSAIADVDNDGNLDLLITGLDVNSDNTTELYLGDGSGGFTRAGEFNETEDVFGGSSSIADVDNDGNQDLLITGDNDASDSGGESATLYLGDGSGGFTRADADLAGVEFSSSAIADVDNDGNRDLLITGESLANSSATLYVNAGAFDFLAASSSKTVGSDGTVDFGDTGATISFSGTSGSGEVTVQRFSNAPANPLGIEKANVSNYRFAISTGGNLTFDNSTEVRLDISTLDGINDASNVTVYKRSTRDNGLFSSLSTTYDSESDELVVTTNSFSEFVLASDTESLEGGGSGTLAAPSNLSATVSTSPAAVLSWDGVGSDALERYRLYRDTAPITGSPSDLSPFDSTEAGTTSFTDEPDPGQTYYYRVTAVDTAGTESGFSGEASAFLYPSEVTASASRTFGGATDSTGYRLVALPGQADTPLADAVNGEAGAQWQAYYDDGSEEDFLVRFDGSDAFTFEAGNGFWLTATSEWTFDGSAPTVDLRGDSAAAINLREGWNVISNPLDKDVGWASVEAATGADLQPIWAFGGSFDSTDTFASAATGEAYYFFNDTGADSLVVPYPGAPGNKAAAKAEKNAPMLALTATAAESESPSSTVRMGVAETGDAEQAVIAPPGRFAETSLRIEAPGPDQSKRTRYLMAERRPPAESGGHTFRLRLASQADGPVTMSASNLDAAEGREVALLHPSAGATYDLRAEETVTVNPEDETADLKLAVGTEGYVKDKTEAVLPKEVQLTSYPNPMRRQGTIEYALPEAQKVSLKVYDVLGRQVATFATGRKDAGRHTVRLETAELSSGVYFGRLQTEEQTLTQKITVVR